MQDESTVQDECLPCEDTLFDEFDQEYDASLTGMHESWTRLKAPQDG